ncbi:MAG: alpha-galactosidase, partial [Actinomycetota bacterium]
MKLRFLHEHGAGVSFLHSFSDTGARFEWALTNVEPEPQRVRSVALVFAVDDIEGPLRMFRHGYQSWSWSDVATFGVDVDPSTLADNEFFQAGHHADQRTVTERDELRSEWFTVLADDGAERIRVGFGGSGDHDGTLRLRHAADGSGVELWAEAFLGDAELAPRESRPLHPVITKSGTDELELLDSWADRVGASANARTGAPFQVGWCSWYH